MREPSYLCEISLWKTWLCHVSSFLLNRKHGRLPRKARAWRYSRWERCANCPVRFPLHRKECDNKQMMKNTSSHAFSGMKSLGFVILIHQWEVGQWKELQQRMLNNNRPTWSQGWDVRYWLPCIVSFSPFNILCNDPPTHAYICVPPQVDHACVNRNEPSARATGMAMFGPPFPIFSSPELCNYSFTLGQCPRSGWVRKSATVFLKIHISKGVSTGPVIQMLSCCLAFMFVDWLRDFWMIHLKFICEVSPNVCGKQQQSYYPSIMVHFDGI